MIVCFFLLPPPDSDDDLLTAEEAAQLLRVAPRTLLERKAGTVTLPRQPGRLARYRRGDVAAWLRQRAERAGKPKQKSFRLLTRKKRDRKGTE